MKKILLLALLGFVSLSVYSSGGGGGGASAADDQTQSSNVLSNELIKHFQFWTRSDKTDELLSKKFNKVLNDFDKTEVLKTEEAGVLFRYFNQKWLNLNVEMAYTDGRREYDWRFVPKFYNDISSANNLCSVMGAISFWQDFVINNVTSPEEARALLNRALEKSTFSRFESSYYDKNGALNQIYKDAQGLENAIAEVSINEEKVQELLNDFNESWFETLDESVQETGFSWQTKLKIYFDTLKSFSDRLKSLLEKLKYDALPASEKLTMKAKAAASTVSNAASAAASSVSSLASAAWSYVPSFSVWGRKSPAAGDTASVVGSPAAGGDDAASTVDSPAASSDGLVEVEVEVEVDDTDE